MLTTDTSAPESGAPPAGSGMPGWFWHLFSAIGFILLLAGVFVLRSELDFAKTAQPAVGTVIGYSQNKDIEDDVWMYAPMVEFTTADGQPSGFTSSNKSSTREYEVGEEVSVLYDPTDPTSAKLAAAKARYLLPAILLLLGVVLTALGLTGHFYITPKLKQAN